MNQRARCKRHLNVDESEVRLVGEARPLRLTWSCFLLTDLA